MMKIEVGKWYHDEDGNVGKCIKAKTHDGGDLYIEFDNGDIIPYLNDGRSVFGIYDDIIKECEE